MQRRHNYRLPGRTRHRAGFTLVEILVVVGIVGLLATTAMTNYKAHVSRAHRSEAYVILNGIYQYQMAFKNENGRYGSTFTEIGFDVHGGQAMDDRTIVANNYTYTIAGITIDGFAGANFVAVATGDLDKGDDILDILTIENNLTIVQD